MVMHSNHTEVEPRPWVTYKHFAQRDASYAVFRRLPLPLALSHHLNVRFATRAYSRTPAKQKRTIESGLSSGASKLITTISYSMIGGASSVHETCSYAVLEYEAMDRSL